MEKIGDTIGNLFIFNSIESKFVGVCFMGKESANTFWKITCPCGVEVVYPVNKLPEINTPHPCGNPNHWTVKYEIHSPEFSNPGMKGGITR
jgi:hypothetical protein